MGRWTGWSATTWIVGYHIDGTVDRLVGYHMDGTVDRLVGYHMDGTVNWLVGYYIDGPVESWKGRLADQQTMQADEGKWTPWRMGE